MSKKRTHHSNNHRSRGVFAGAVSALSLLAVTTQAVNAEQLTVKSGDTIWGLAKQHGLSVSALEQANPSVKKINDSIDLITVGQQLTLPTAQHDASADLNADGSYTVKPGDTLSSIADRYNVTVSQLMAWNNLSTNDSLYIGQQLSVTDPAISTAVNAPAVSAPVAQSTDATSSVQVQTSAVASASVPQRDVASSQPAGTVPSQSAANSNATLANNTATVATGSSAANSVATATDAAQTTTANTASTSAENSVAPQTQNVAVSQAASTAVNTTALYGQSFVQAAPVASQAPQSQTAPASQATVNVQNSNAAASQQTTAVTSQTQPQQSQAAASQPAQQAATTNQDLQHGSVVSLATKIANSNSVPYVWGGESLSGMDCSGLVKYVYANAEGKQLPHYTGALENCVDQHPVSEAKPGDLLFWGNHGSTYHTAIYTGNNQYVAAAHPGTNVSTYTISSYFNPSFAGTVK
ncbi:C40 family peptidase [Limosilactobacillus reuteri]|uniref:NLP/P60 protein n=2 Tax=Limosilactobacillus reuteri TaxID=1598 RepID=A5VJ66_LIMRD|nr:C40 family peptidase [Limosilactobacillus reuteri]ABQ82890.1 NLP/P60 protein [Limosilactobacillus reuteri subsp. reuteri]AKP00866.1 NLP/P60 protein [Limosilactobacillus reuteri]EEI08596.1 LysM domain protein [Limosilactobacillus reuteri MM2-3]EGC15399.1 LysM domain protein [Limosilactobacillus reuteri MM4-1A]KRK52220.1 NLP P60 protein [Limosilactobacillus reuteri subsp. reuteri]